MNELRTATVQWRRVSVEALAIVSSILLAFAIDAWWGSLQDSATARSHLEGVLSEVEVSRDAIQRQADLTREASQATSALLALTPAEAAQLSSDSLATMLDRSIRAGSVTLPSGALEALIASGDLGLLDDRELAARLAQWPSLASRAEEAGSILIRNREEQILPFMAPYIGGLWTGKKSPWLAAYPPSRFPLQAEAMFRNPEFEGYFALRGIRLEVALDNYERLAAQADSLMETIRLALGG